MPDRIIRDELLESERWLTLKDNADRLAYIALLLRADSLGNFSAEPFRLLRLWRDFGINTAALVSKTLIELSDHDLIRVYSQDDKAFLHIPRYHQRLRHLKRVFPPSPWTTSIEKQRLIDNPPVERQASDRLASAEGKGSEVKGSEVKNNNTPANAGYFSEFWEAYPRKTAKQTALKAFRRLKAGEVAPVLAAVEVQKGSEQWLRGIIPHAATWLNQRRWEDELQAGENLGQCMWNHDGARDSHQARCPANGIEERDRVIYCKAHLHLFGERIR